MEDFYRKWINDKVPTADAAYAKCAEITLAMAEEFLELDRVRGIYHCPIWGKRTHWWLKDEDGNVVDPTAKQFPSGGIGEYQEITNDEECPTGRCPNCGEMTYKFETVCSAKCYEEFRRYLIGR